MPERLLRVASLMLVAAAIVACGSDSDPTPADSLQQQVESLFPAGAARDQAVTMAGEIIAAAEAGDDATAQAGVFDLAELTFAEFYAGRLLPAPAQQPAAIDALLTDAFDLASLPDPGLEAAHFDDEGLMAVVRAAGGTFATATQRAGIEIPAAAVPQTALLLLRRLADSSQFAPRDGPLPTDLDQYPLFYDFSFTPEIELTADAIIGICQFADPASAYYPADGIFARLQLAHPDPANRSVIELLPRADASFLDCDGTTANARGLMSLRRVGIGGRVRKFSPFAAVDGGEITLPNGLIEPVGYRSFAGSPFNGVSLPGYFHLENWEDGLVNTPGVTPSSTSTGSSFPGFEDSVDGDDGVVDGTCSKPAGRCDSGFANGEISFTFEVELLGGLPTHVGIVWTDGGFGADVTFEAYDAANVLIGTRTVPGLGDNSNFGTVEEDRFFGVVASGGVRRIVVRNTGGGIEVDHLQYGR
jgi:hypothetical protein